MAVSDFNANTKLSMGPANRWSISADADLNSDGQITYDETVGMRSAQSFLITNSTFASIIGDVYKLMGTVASVTFRWEDRPFPDFTEMMRVPVLVENKYQPGVFEENDFLVTANSARMPELGFQEIAFRKADHGTVGSALVGSIVLTQIQKFHKAPRVQ